MNSVLAMLPLSPGLIGGIVGAIIGVIGGLIGTYFSIKNTNGPRERVFIIKMSVVGWAFVIAFVLAMSFAPGGFYKTPFFLVYAIALIAGILLVNKMQAQIRLEESKSAPPAASSTQILPRKCPQCGAELKPDTPEGLCPACLLQHGIATEGGVPPGTPPFVPPGIFDLARLFPQLEIFECLGRGGMGAVYKARQPRLDRLVALKILAPEKQSDPQFAERFEREARALARLNHPDIVAVYDFGEVEGRFYLLMEFVDGLSLRQLFQAGRMKPEQALTIVPKICEALQYAHEQGIVHRDIKPENILLDKSGRVKIADFGIAKMVGVGAGQQMLTGAKDVVGTPHYMAPEQIEKPQTVDHRADIYSLGVVFYEMLTGELPLGKFQPPSSKVQIDVRLDEVVLHALEKEPERRYQQASVLKTAVETIATTPSAPNKSVPASGNLLKVSQCCVSTPEHLRTFLGRHFYPFQAKGELRLDSESLNFDSGWSVIKIPLASISALAVGAHPLSSFTYIKLMMMPGNYLAVTFSEHGVARTLLFTPTPPLDTVRARVKYRLADPKQKIREHSLVLMEWLQALQEAIQARTGNKLPLEQHSAATAPSKWNQVMWYCLCVGFIALFGQRPLLGMLSGLWPGPITTSLAAVNSLPGAARSAAWIAISIVDAGLILLLIMLLVRLLIKFSVAVGPIPRKLSVQFANFFPPQPTNEKSWLAIVDSGKYAESWEMAAGSFHHAIRKEEWVARLEKVRRPLGKVISRKLRSIKYSRWLRSLQDAAVGTRLEQKFNTSFDGLPAAVETITCAKQQDGSWRIIGYLIRPAGFRLFRGWLPLFLLVLTCILAVSSFFYFNPAKSNHVASAETWAPKLAPGEKPDLQKIRDEIQSLMNAGDYESALQRQIWYFNHALEFGESNPVRLSFGIMQWGELGRRYPKARRALIEIRDRDVRQFAAAGGYYELFSEVVNINRELGDEDATYALFKSIEKLDPQLTRQCYGYAEDLLVEKGEYAVCLKYLGDPQAKFEFIRSVRERVNELLDRTPQANQSQMRKQANNQFVNDTRRLVEILVGTGHKAEAEKIQSQAVAVLDAPHLQTAVSDAEQKIKKRSASESDIQPAISTAPLPEPNDLLQAQAKLAELRGDYAEQSSTVQRALARVKELERMSKEEPNASAELREARAHLAELSVDYAEQNPRIQEALARINVLEQNRVAPVEISPILDEQPPVVVETFPVSGARDVAPGTAEIRVRFSKGMADGSWSWSTAWQDSTPESVGPPHYLDDHRTCVMKVRLEQGRTYAWWLNSEKFKNFTDQAGRPAIPYLLIFQTKPN